MADHRNLNAVPTTRTVCSAVAFGAAGLTSAKKSPTKGVPRTRYLVTLEVPGPSQGMRFRRLTNLRSTKSNPHRAFVSSTRRIGHGKKDGNRHHRTSPARTRSAGVTH